MNLLITETILEKLRNERFTIGDYLALTLIKEVDNSLLNEYSNEFENMELMLSEQKLHRTGYIQHYSKAEHSDYYYSITDKGTEFLNSLKE